MSDQAMPSEAATTPATAAAEAPPRVSVTAGAQTVLPAALGLLVPLAIVLYLSLDGGGYDLVSRGAVGILSWIAVAAALLSGVFTLDRLSRSAALVLAALGTLAVWSFVGLAWSESAERTFVEATRLSAYLGIFSLALIVTLRGGQRRVVTAVAAAIAAVSVLALLSRLEPGWFPTNEAAEVISGAEARLSYPLNYWNGLGTMIGIGIPLLVMVAATARTALARAAATAVLPILLLAMFFTLSRGGMLAAAIGLLAFVVLHPQWRAAIAPLALGAGGGGLLIALAASRSALTNNPGSELALEQGDEMLLWVGIVCVVAGALAVPLGRLTHRIPPFPTPARRLASSRRAQVGGAVAVVAAAIALGIPSQAADRWEAFKGVTVVGPASDRLTAASGNGRYQYWESTVAAVSENPLTGTGPGTFEFWWAREGTLEGYARFAHSLLFQTLGESGIVGAALLLGLLFSILVIGVRRIRRADGESAAVLAAAVGGAVAFTVGMILDWGWEIAAIPVAFLFLAAVIVVSPESAPPWRKQPKRSLRWRVLAASACALFALLIALPVAAELSVRDSRQKAAAQSFGSALSAAERAQMLQPFAATPYVQEAHVHAETGDNRAAAAAMLEAAMKEPTNWEHWYALSEIEGRLGRREAAEAHFERARSLNPRSPVFSEPEAQNSAADG